MTSSNGTPNSNGSPKKKATKKKAAKKKRKTASSKSRPNAKQKKELIEVVKEAGVEVPEKDRNPDWDRPYDDSPIVRNYKYGRCKAMSKQTKKEDGTPGRCRKPAGPTGVCYYHGGEVYDKRAMKKRGGRRNYNENDDRWTSAIGDQLGLAYETALGDEQLINLRRGLAVLDVAVQKTMLRLEKHDTPDWREAVKEKVMELADAAYLDHEGQRILKETRKLLNKGLGEDMALERLIQTVTALQQGVEKYWNVQIRGHETLTTAQVGAVFRRMIGVLLRVYGDDAERAILEIDRECMGGRLALTRTEDSSTGDGD